VVALGAAVITEATRLCDVKPGRKTLVIDELAVAVDVAVPVFVAVAASAPLTAIEAERRAVIIRLDAMVNELCKTRWKPFYDLVFFRPGKTSGGFGSFFFVSFCVPGNSLSERSELLV
jgi:hypothetical protein